MRPTTALSTVALAVVAGRVAAQDDATSLPFDQTITTPAEASAFSTTIFTTSSATDTSLSTSIAPMSGPSTSSILYLRSSSATTPHSTANAVANDLGDPSSMSIAYTPTGTATASATISTTPFDNAAVSVTMMALKQPALGLILGLCISLA
ncbi:hypothetical protein FRC01_006298 [Tulasnella sp. 417]|nr:hypothetical protein FRC01_006298 [Tulasnella sp. 417]